MRSAEDILEDILDQLQNQGSIAESVAENMRNTVKSTPPPTKETEEFSSKLDIAKDAANEFADGLMRGANDTKGRVTDMAQGLKTVTGVIPGVAPVFTKLIEATEMVYKFMNEQRSNYIKLNEAGLQVTDGMFGLYGAMANARLTQDEFMQATANYRDVMASMGSDGLRDFGDMLNTVIETQESMGLLNMTNQTMAKSMASYIKLQKDYGVFDELNKQTEAQAAREYMDNMNNFSKSLGMSVDELTDIMSKSSEKTKGLGVQMALAQKGMDPKQAAAVAQNFNMVAGSLGEFGNGLSDAISSFIVTGKMDINSTFGKIYQANDDLKALVDEVVDMAKDGTLATADGADRFRQIATDPRLAESLRGTMVTTAQAFGTEVSDTLGAYTTSLQRYNKDIAEQDAKWDYFVNMFNMTVDGWTRGVKTTIADTFISFFDPSKVEDIVGSKALAGQLNRPVTEIFSVLGDGIAYAADNISESVKAYLSELQAKWDAITLPTWQDIAESILPDWLLDIIADSGELGTAEDVASKLSNAVDNYVGDVTNQIANAANEVSADVSESVTGTMSSMYDSVAKWWSKPSAQTVIQKTVVQQKALAVQPVQAPEAKVEAPLPPASNTEQMIADKIEEIFKPMIEAQKAQAEQLAKISKNTRNTVSGINAAQGN